MSRSRATVLIVVLALVAAFAVQRAGRRYTASLRTGPQLTHEVRAAGLRFAPSVLPADRQLVLHEIAAARPEAQRLIHEVDGLVTVYVGPAGGTVDAIGLTESRPDGYAVTLDLAPVWAREGERGVQRLVLHELGHVVDFALVKPALATRLDALIPRGYACDPRQPTSACAPREERFAETFSKWCTGDIGFNLSIGYKVQPPDSLDGWGAQLVAGIGAA
jgi:hypothetical protein